MEDKKSFNSGRRDFLRRLGMGVGAAVSMTVMEPFQMFAQKKEEQGGVTNRMTYRVQHGSGEQISLLGFGMMRLPNNQDEVDKLVDYAIAHGVNYFDTAPMYMGGQSEVLTGNTLSRFLATNTSWLRRCRTRTSGCGTLRHQSGCMNSRLSG